MIQILCQLWKESTSWYYALHEGGVLSAISVERQEEEGEKGDVPQLRKRATRDSVRRLITKSYQKE